jgi:hypothetical protein
MGDACEMLIAAELTLAGIPALTVPAFWPGHDVIAQPRDGRPSQRISVKSRTFKKGAAFVGYWEKDAFDWLAIVILPDTHTLMERRYYLVPRTLADEKARRDSPTAKTAAERYWRLDQVDTVFAPFRDNFLLKDTPTRTSAEVQSLKVVAGA